MSKKNQDVRQTFVGERASHSATEHEAETERLDGSSTTYSVRMSDVGGLGREIGR